MLINRVCNALKECGVNYAIVGGYAVALHGVVRGTLDIDYVIEWNLENLQKAEEGMKKGVQYFTKEYLEYCKKLTPDQIIKFLDDFRILMAKVHGNKKFKN